MLLSTSNTILVTALALNVASTLGAPIPAKYTNDVYARAADQDSGLDLHSRYLDVLVPKKRFRSWNKTRRAARESALKVLRHAEARAAALAETRESIRRMFDLEDRDFGDYEEEESRELSPAHRIGRRSPYSADDLEDLVARDFDDELETRHAHRNKKTKGNGKGKSKARTQSTVVSFGNGWSNHHNGMCPCAHAPPQIQNPCPQHPGNGSGGGNSPPSGTNAGPTATDTSFPNGPTGLPTGTDTGPTSTDTAPGSTSTGLPDGGGDDGNSTATSTGLPDGGGDDGNSTATAIPSATDSSSVPTESGAPDTGSNTTSPDDGGNGGNSTGTTGNSTTNPTDDGNDGGNSTSTSDPSSDSGSDGTSTPDKRSLFERWLSERTTPVRRVNSARFRQRI
ncbi:hypothetical protein FB451DRAFT_1278898 [Mycena latifolia]|nr:hypothetical protein FB451DRAFT_1278898 [Mycena latifolia]